VLLDAGEAAELELAGQTPAGVLVPLHVPPAPAQPDIGQLLAVPTRRRDDLRRHAGEVSFPGGRRDAGDPDLIATALREAEEEIGLPHAAVTIVGALQPTSTFATNYAIYPFVGLLAPGQEWRISPQEVDAVLELSLHDLAGGYRRTQLERRGVSFRTDAYVVGEHFVWGATARIIGDLLARVQPMFGSRAA
jgi:8-oxo-dGTP pyrophosphatase MutT (NUDIX family)